MKRKLLHFSFILIFLLILLNLFLSNFYENAQYNHSEEKVNTISKSFTEFGIGLNYPSSWTLTQSSESFRNEEVHTIYISKNDYEVKISISNIQHNPDSNGGVIEISDNYVTKPVKENVIMVFPKISQPLVKPYNFGQVIFLDNQQIQNQTFFDNFFYNDKFSISITYSTPSSLDLDIVAEQEGILSNIEYLSN